MAQLTKTDLFSSDIISPCKTCLPSPPSRISPPQSSFNTDTLRHRELDFQTPGYTSSSYDPHPTQVVFYSPTCDRVNFVNWSWYYHLTNHSLWYRITLDVGHSCVIGLWNSHRLESVYSPYAQHCISVYYRLSSVSAQPQVSEFSADYIFICSQQ